MSTFSAYDAIQAREFAERWLPAWTGDDPERLVAFYSDDVFYSDPAIPRGVRGRDPLLAYFRKLLARNPNWVWTQRGSLPLADGFLNEWHASVPVGRTDRGRRGLHGAAARGSDLPQSGLLRPLRLDGRASSAPLGAARSFQRASCRGSG